MIPTRGMYPAMAMYPALVMPPTSRNGSAVACDKDTSIQCQGCQIIVSSVEDWLADNATVVAIEHYLEWVCYLIPMYNQSCYQLVESGVPTLIKYIEIFETPLVVCQQIKIC